MSENIGHTIPSSTDIKISDICGLWEVIRICEGDKIALYPWLRERFMFNFLDEMMFVCIKDGQHSRGKWELTEKSFENKNRFSIILNGTFEYVIVDISEDEITLSDHKCKYFLVRKL